MKISAEKWQAYGNDYIVVAGDLEQPVHLSSLAVAICDRHQGAGADGIVAYDRVSASVHCRIFNPDGSEAEMSGNGLRCLAGFLKERLPAEKVFLLNTTVGVRTLTFLREEEPSLWFRADMGQPDFNPAALPAEVEGETALRYPVHVGGGKIEVNLVSLGNPHCVVILPDLFPEEWPLLGPKLESHQIFPRRTNVEFVKVLNSHSIEVRIWERGVGKTFSSGTGSSASAAVAIRLDLAKSPVRVYTERGELTVEWEPGQSIFLEGPTIKVWSGEFYWQT
ncbi:MAG TPA: diaminopimelate epimerase [Acidobacteriota bacterium]|jgi:diaminopimelate epimerase